MDAIKPVQEVVDWSPILKMGSMDATLKSELDRLAAEYDMTADIAGLDSALIGSWEATTRQKDVLQTQLSNNTSGLPDKEIDFCNHLANAIGPEDGFRRRAVPPLLYRYFVDMQSGLRSVANLLKPGAGYALIVGHNHTVLSGVRRDIDTPGHLMSLAERSGWAIEESVPLQTYQRFGLHAANAVGAETLILLRRVQTGQ